MVGWMGSTRLEWLMRQKMFLAKKRHNYLIMVQELILKLAKKNVRGVEFRID